MGNERNPYLSFFQYDEPEAHDVFLSPNHSRLIQNGGEASPTFQILEVIDPIKAT